MTTDARGENRHTPSQGGAAAEDFDPARKHAGPARPGVIDGSGAHRQTQGYVTHPVWQRVMPHVICPVARSSRASTVPRCSKAAADSNVSTVRSSGFSFSLFMVPHQ